MKRLSIIALLLALFMLAGCTAPAPKPAAQGAKNGFRIFTAAMKDTPKSPRALYKSESAMMKDEEGYSEALRKWADARDARREAGEKAPKLEAFTHGLYAELMRENGDNNTVCSPISVYIALAMLAEVTGGDTRAEILEALGEKDIEALRIGVAALLEAETLDDGVSKSLIGNSIWLNKGLEYKEEPMKKLAEIYGASSFSGDPNDEGFKQALRDWINENTGGLLKDAAKDIEPGSLLTLASTIYFKARWENEFPKGSTKDDTFHAVSGDAKVPFMHTSIMGGRVLKSANFTAVPLPMKEQAGYMWLFLPDEGAAPQDIEEGALRAVCAGIENLEGGWLIDIALPKFDVGSNLDLIPAVKAMGVNSCFTSPDFSPMLNGEQDAVVSRIAHAARVKVDEEGLEAAAYTVITADGALLTEKQLEITFDSPFMFVITGTSGAPLFMGTVNSL